VPDRATAFGSLLYANILQPNGQPQTCQGGPNYNSWYGSGQVNAFNAVTQAFRN